MTLKRLLTYPVDRGRSGPGSQFRITNDTPAPVLTFKMDARLRDLRRTHNRDNVYEVTVVASASGKSGRQGSDGRSHQRRRRSKIKLSQRVPKVNVPLTATLSDEDGMTSIITWEWYRTTGDSCPTTDTDYDMDSPDASSWGNEAIADANTDTYMPVDADSGKCLLAHASYNDGTTTDGTTARLDPKNVYKQSDDVTIAADPGGPNICPPRRHTGRTGHL